MMTDLLTIAVAIANLLGILVAGVTVAAYTRVKLEQILSTLREIAERLRTAEEIGHALDKRLVRLEEWRLEHRVGGQMGK